MDVARRGLRAGARAESRDVFQGWDNFYFMLGSAGAGLIGLLFVVVALTAGFEQSRALWGQKLYMTPTALQFGMVLAVSAVALAPGLPTAATAAIFGVIGLIGLANAVRACVGIADPGSGGPASHWSDLWTYGVAPAAIYLGLCATTAAIWTGAAWAAYAVAALVLALLLLGIRNAWDLVTWIAPRTKGDAG
jgi:hypothetical protein